MEATLLWQEKLVHMKNSFWINFFSFVRQHNYRGGADERSFPADIMNADPAFFGIYSTCKDFTMTSVERMYALYEGINYLIRANIPGDIVECGVWKGGSSMLSASTLLHLGDLKRKIYLYDTYAGMTEPTDEDVRLAKQRRWAFPKWEQMQKEDHNDWCCAPIEEVKENLRMTRYPESNFLFVKGKVEETIPKIVPEKIALLRLDTDWYISTKHELEYLFPLLSQGGVLIIDDYGHWAGAKKAADEFFKTRPMYLARVDQTARVGIKTAHYGC